MRENSTPPSVNTVFPGQIGISGGLHPFRFARHLIVLMIMLSCVSAPREHLPCGMLSGEFSPVLGRGTAAARSGVAGCFLGELHPGAQAEFGVDVGEVGLHGAR